VVLHLAAASDVDAQRQVRKVVKSKDPPIRKKKAIMVLQGVPVHYKQKQNLLVTMALHDCTRLRVQHALTTFS